MTRRPEVFSAVAVAVAFGVAFGVGAFAVVLAGCGKTSRAEPAASAASASRGEGSASDSSDSSEAEEHVAGVEGDPDDIQVAPTASPAGASGPAAFLAEATRVLDTMTASTYTHKTHIDGTVYDVDCSGFVDYVLGRAAPVALTELRAATVKRPLARHFVDFFAAPTALRTAWEHIARVQDLSPGSLVAWRKPDDVTSTNTGHVMIVAGAPTHQKDGAWSVPIIDASASPHGKDDTRKHSRATGVGRGTMVLETNAAGAPVAYRWSPLHSSHRHATEVAMGRVR
jgi:hypothetical protein